MSRACSAALEGDFHYGPLQLDIELELKTGGNTTVPCNNLLSYLDVLYSRTSSFKGLLDQRHSTAPSSVDHPWGLVIYTDELVPGNPLGPGLRKTWCIYGTFVQFSLDDLSNELSWLSLLHVRSSIIDKVKGGISQLLKQLLKTIFLGPCDPRFGLLLPGPDGSSLKLFFDLQVLLQDGGSHKYTWSNKGDAGLKPCLLCNVQAEPKGGDETLAEGEAMESRLGNCSTLSALKVFSNEEILGSYDRLQSRQQSMKKKDFGLWQKAVGLTWQPCLLPLDAELRAADLVRPASQYGHDWMHAFCSGGCMNVAMFYFLEALPKEVSWIFFATYVQKWNMPKHLNATSLHLLFADKKVKGYREKNKFTCQASEVLTLLPVMVHFCKSVVQPANCAPDACKAFLAVATVVFLLSEGQQAGITTPGLLQEAVEACLAAWFAAGWDLIPKYHWPLHMPSQLQRWGKLLSCFTCERKNKIVKKWGNPMHNTSNFESAVRKEILAEEIARLQMPGVFQEGPCLLNPHPATKQLTDFICEWIGQHANVSTGLVCKLQNCNRCSKGDIVLLQGDMVQAAQVFAFVTVPGHVLCLLQYLDVENCNLETASANCTLSPTKDLQKAKAIPSNSCCLGSGCKRWK